MDKMTVTEMSDEEILNVKSPTAKVTGPFVVLKKNTEDKWAAVALNWESNPRIGIRWFWPPKGNPCSHGLPTWFIVPPQIDISIIDSLGLTYDQRNYLLQFLRNEINGDKLKSKF